MIINISKVLINLTLFSCASNKNQQDKNQLQRFTSSYIQNSQLSEYKKDFDYKELSIVDLGRMTMPYINCNCNVFASSENDLIDMFLSDNRQMLNDFLSKFENFKLKF